MGNMVSLAVRSANAQTGGIDAGMKFVSDETFAWSLAFPFYDINEVRHDYLAPYALAATATTCST